MSILLAPEGEEPLNQGKLLQLKGILVHFLLLEAGQMLQADPEQYYTVARNCARGSTFRNVKYDAIIKD